MAAPVAVYTGHHGCKAASFYNPFVITHQFWWNKVLQWSQLLLCMGKSQLHVLYCCPPISPGCCQSEEPWLLITSISIPWQPLLNIKLIQLFPPGSLNPLHTFYLSAKLVLNIQVQKCIGSMLRNSLKRSRYKQTVAPRRNKGVHFLILPLPPPCATFHLC